jgi:CDP-glucose 4,6-dehydratase
MFSEVFKGKKILVTGNTGFKGAWLSAWLLQLEAKVYGFSIDIPTQPSMFEALDLENKLEKQYYADINDAEVCKKILNDVKPDFFFHLAAQAIVSISYDDPVETFETNVIGTANIIEALKTLENPCTAVLISSDKCYENKEWKYGYRESDELGGWDPYSASKGACEVIINSYYQSFFSAKDSNVKAVSVRAGNVVGGGDWAINRLVPDCIRSWANKEEVVIRRPKSVRPWQHVLEPLSGYLRAAEELYKRPDLNGEPYNFGPPSHQVNNVLEMINELSKSWDSGDNNYRVDDTHNFHEAGLLKLNCDKALEDLNWRPNLVFEETVQLTAEWYKAYYLENGDMYAVTSKQIKQFQDLAIDKNISWAIS